MMCNVLVAKRFSVELVTEIICFLSLIDIWDSELHWTPWSYISSSTFKQKKSVLFNYLFALTISGILVFKWKDVYYRFVLLMFAVSKILQVLRKTFFDQRNGTRRQETITTCCNVIKEKMHNRITIYMRCVLIRRLQWFNLILFWIFTAAKSNLFLRSFHSVGRWTCT